MLINLRNALMTGKRLPYDAEVEYLQSSGTQYIDTLVNADSNLSVEVTMATIAGTLWSNVNTAGAILLDPVLRHHLNFSTIGGSKTVNYYFGPGNTPIRSNYAPANQVPFTLRVDAIGKTFSIESFTVELPTGSFDTGLTYWLFARNNTGSATASTYMRIYSARLWNGLQLVRDFIPVRKGTVGYLYDRVSGKLFGNAGTGDFKLGQDVVPVEYIESHGTEYINTDKSVDLPMHLEADINFTNPSTGTKVQTLVGGYNASLTNQRFWVTSLPQGKINCGLLTNSISTNLVPANRKVRLVVDFENGRQVATIDGVQYTSASQSTTNYWFRDWKLRIFQSFGTRVDSDPLQAITNRIDIDIGASQALRLLPVRVGTDATSWEGAMMDVLTRRVYRNAGTGAFTYGNDLKYPIPAS